MLQTQLVAWALSVVVLFGTGLAEASPLKGAYPVISSADGAAGFWRVRTPTGLPVGHLALGLSMELNRERGLGSSDGLWSRYAGRLTLGGVPVRGLQIYAGASLIATESEGASPEQTLTAGNPYLGLRYGRQLSRRWSVGGGLMLQVPSGNDGQLLAFSGASLEASASFEFRPVPKLRLALELGYRRDNTAETFAGPLTVFQSYSADVQPANLLRIQTGATYRWGRVAALLELGAQIPVGAGSGEGTPPSWLTLGARAWPLANRRLYLQAGVDIGLTGVGAAASGTLIPNRRYNVFLTAGWVFGGKPATVVKVKVVRTIVHARCPKPTGPAHPPGARIVGLVVDKVTGRPVRGARVTLSPGTGQRMTLLSRSPDGSFSTCRVPNGPLKLRVAKVGFKPLERVILVSQGVSVPVKIVLNRSKAQSYGVVKGIVHSVGGKPLVANVTIPTRSKRATTVKTNGHFHFKLLTGTFDLLITRKGYVTQRHKIHLLPGEEVILDVELHPKK